MDMGILIIIFYTSVICHDAPLRLYFIRTRNRDLYTIIILQRTCYCSNDEKICTYAQIDKHVNSYILLWSRV